MFATKSMPCSRPWHSEAGHKPLIKQQEQLMFFCQLILSVTFKAVQLRYSLTKAQQPCRNPFIPVYYIICRTNAVILFPLTLVQWLCRSPFLPELRAYHKAFCPCKDLSQALLCRLSGKGLRELLTVPAADFDRKAS